MLYYSCLHSMLVVHAFYAPMILHYAIFPKKNFFWLYLWCMHIIICHTDRCTYMYSSICWRCVCVCVWLSTYIASVLRMKVRAYVILLCFGVFLMLFRCGIVCLWIIIQQVKCWSQACDLRLNSFFPNMKHLCEDNKIILFCMHTCTTHDDSAAVSYSTST